MSMKVRSLKTIIFNMEEKDNGQQSSDKLAASLKSLRGSLWAVALAVIFAGATIAVSILFIGKLWLEMGRGGGGTAAVPPQQVEPQGQQPEKTGDPSTVSLDDDPVLGDRSKAKVAIVEFSDYECPFCKRFHQQTFDRLVKEYVDTGKAVLVFRDFPLSFHEPMASTEAQAASCVKELAGDKAYFDYGKLVFEKTGANGEGVVGTTLEELAAKVGVDVEKFKACAQSGKFKEEIAKDMADGEKAGVDGTPAFIIGRLQGNDVVDGMALVGAQPFEAFKKVVDEKLR
jgi:protein-disulfide isomerase